METEKIVLLMRSWMDNQIPLKEESQFYHGIRAGQQLLIDKLESYISKESTNKNLERER